MHSHSPPVVDTHGGSGGGSLGYPLGYPPENPLGYDPRDFWGIAKGSLGVDGGRWDTGGGGGWRNSVGEVIDPPLDYRPNQDTQNHLSNDDLG